MLRLSPWESKRGSIYCTSSAAGSSICRKESLPNGSLFSQKQTQHGQGQLLNILEKWSTDHHQLCRHAYSIMMFYRRRKEGKIQKPMFKIYSSLNSQYCTNPYSVSLENFFLPFTGLAPRLGYWVASNVSAAPYKISSGSPPRKDNNNTHKEYLLLVVWTMGNFSQLTTVVET